MIVALLLPIRGTLAATGMLCHDRSLPTMVFQAKAPATLDELKEGDRIKFTYPSDAFATEWYVSGDRR